MQFCYFFSDVEASRMEYSPSMRASAFTLCVDLKSLLMVDGVLHHPRQIRSSRFAVMYAFPFGGGHIFCILRSLSAPQDDSLKKRIHLDSHPSY